MLGRHYLLSNILLTKLVIPSIIRRVVANISVEVESWMTLSFEYLITEAMPEDRVQVWELQIRATRYIILEDQLYIGVSSYLFLNV